MFKVTHEITNKKLFDSKVDEVDTSDLVCIRTGSTDNIYFEGHIIICEKNKTIFYDFDEYKSSHFEKKYGFVLKPEKE